MQQHQQQQQQQQQNNLMDFKVLSKYDDLFTDIFLDNLFLWFNTIKMNNDHRRPRVPNNKILDIIQRNILEKSKPMDAVNELLAMDYFKHYLAVKNQKQVQEFIQHMKRYLYMYMPNAGYEVGDTRRYGGNGRRVEACLVATKDWQTGDEMRLLTGMIACLDPKDDAELKRGNRDFSVMWSTRKNCSCLFLGPARFANHDCDSNCKFISLGQNSITFKVVKDIKCGEEITVYYGKHYFGENNCECRCITCEKHSMGNFATLETDENSPIDIQEEGQGSTRRSTRKRKSALHEEYSHTTSSNTPRRLKRASLEPTTRHSADSLEDLIGEEEKQQALKSREDDMEIENSTSPPPVKKEIAQIIKREESLPPIPISPTTEGMARLKVMSIGFLCGSDEEEESSHHTTPPPPPLPISPMYAGGRDRRVSDCPYLDLLVDAAVMDAEYSGLDDKTAAAKKRHSFYDNNRSDQQITVVVNPEIHRDAANRVFLQQQQKQNQKQKQQSTSLPSSPLDSGESKADSAVSLSPRLMTNVKKEEEDDRCWRREMDDGLFSRQDEEERAFDEFCDDVSDLSSVSSTELSTWNSEDEDDILTEEEASAASSPASTTFTKSGRKKPNNSVKTTTSTSIQDLACVGCGKLLKNLDISEQAGADVSVTNELATWTWSPSATFLSWKPERCPRCERHYTIFKQEWPNRKIKKKKILNRKLLKKGKKVSGGSPLKKQSSRPSSPFSAAAAVVKTKSLTEEPNHHLTSTEPVCQIQDDPEDLNYIPPSPLSEVVDDEEEGDAF